MSEAINETDNPLDAHAKVDPPVGAVSSGAATAMQKDSRADAEVRQADYVHAGMAFTDWFNRKLDELPNASIRLGGKNATAVRLYPDGRLECSIHAAAGEEEQTFVAFEGQYLDQLIRKISALGI